MPRFRAASLAIMLVMMIFVWGAVSQAQIDTTSQVDKVHLKDGSILEGKVKVIKTDIVEFVERETNLLYELRKSEIRVILLSSGKSITFADEPIPKTQPQQQAPQPIVIEKDGGTPVGLVILASVGAVLLVLLLIGAAASN